MAERVLGDGASKFQLCRQCFSSGKFRGKRQAPLLSTPLFVSLFFQRRLNCTPRPCAHAHTRLRKLATDLLAQSIGDATADPRILATGHSRFAVSYLSARPGVRAHPKTGPGSREEAMRAAERLFPEVCGNYLGGTPGAHPRGGSPSRWKYAGRPGKFRANPARAWRQPGRVQTRGPSLEVSASGFLQPGPIPRYAKTIEGRCATWKRQLT